MARGVDRGSHGKPRTDHRGNRSGPTQRFRGTVSSEPLILEDGLAYDGHDGVWAGPYPHWTGTKWINTYQVGSMPGGDGFALAGIATIPGSSSIWGTGWVGRSASNHTQDSLIAAYGGTR
jgi:hypothetical protein